jgi:hypothetical protein
VRISSSANIDFDLQLLPLAPIGLAFLAVPQFPGGVATDECALLTVVTARIPG